MTDRPVEGCDFGSLDISPDPSPSATIQPPSINISGLRLTLARSWSVLVAAELTAASAGLGFLLIDSQNNGRVDQILLAITPLAVSGKTSGAIPAIFERWAIRRWT